MDKAVKSIRRSSVKLLSLSGGHEDLNMVISEQKDVRNTAKSFMSAQNSAAQYLMKWAAYEDNRAIQDVSSQVVELNSLWTEVQRDFAEHMKEYRQMYEMILEGERHIDSAKNHLTMCDQRETKIKKELKKAAKKASQDELKHLESKFLQAERAKDLAQLELVDRIREHEAVKTIRFKEGLLRLSEAYVELGKKCAIIHEAQRDIAHHIPDVHGQVELEDIKYTGSGASRQYVVKAKEKLRKYKRISHHISADKKEKRDIQDLPSDLDYLPSEFVEPAEDPPPYTPGNYFQDILQDIPPPVHQNVTTRRSSSNRRNSNQSGVRIQSHDQDDHGSDYEADLSGAMGGASLN